MSQLTSGLAGWPGFNEVFAVSALEGNGIAELKTYLISQAKKSDWIFNPKLKTDLSPPELVINIVKSKCLEVYPGSYPYQLKPQIGEWKVENGVLRLNIQFLVRPSLERYLLGKEKGGLRRVAKLSEVDLQNFFSCPVFMSISVHSNSSKK